MRIAKMLRYAVLFMTDLMVMTGGNNRAMAEKRLVKEIPFSALEGVRIGNAQDHTAKTGVTVLCFPAGAKTGVDISGGERFRRCRYRCDSWQIVRHGAVHEIGNRFPCGANRGPEDWRCGRSECAGRCVFRGNREKDCRTYEPGAHFLSGQRHRAVPHLTAVGSVYPDQYYDRSRYYQR